MLILPIQRSLSELVRRMQTNKDYARLLRNLHNLRKILKCGLYP